VQQQSVYEGVKGRSLSDTRGEARQARKDACARRAVDVSKTTDADVEPSQDVLRLRHEMIQPFVNHLRECASGLISHVLCRVNSTIRTSCCSTAESNRLPSEDERAATSPVEVWPFPYPRSAGPAGRLDQRSRTHAITRARMYTGRSTDHGHPIAEVGGISRHGSI